jgi:hypothetical protein
MYNNLADGAQVNMNAQVNSVDIRIKAIFLILSFTIILLPVHALSPSLRSFKLRPDLAFK